MSSKNYSRQEWGSLSIQERIKAMNQAQIETAEKPAVDRVEDMEETTVEDALPPPRRTSVVDIWRKRDSTTTPNKTSSLQERKISSVSAAERLKKQQAHESRSTRSESKEPNVSKRTSVADLIAARGKLFGTPATDAERQEEHPAKEVIVESVTRNEEPADLTIIANDDPPKTSSKRSSVVDVWAKRGLLARDRNDDVLDSSLEAEKEEKCADESIQTPTKSPSRSNAAKLWEQRGFAARTPSWARQTASSASDAGDTQHPLRNANGQDSAQTSGRRNQVKGDSHTPIWARPKPSPNWEKSDMNQTTNVDQTEGVDRSWGHRVQAKDVSRAPVRSRKQSSAADEANTDLGPRVDHSKEASRAPGWARPRVSGEAKTQQMEEPDQTEGVTRARERHAQGKDVSRAPAWARQKASPPSEQTDKQQTSMAKESTGVVKTWEQPAQGKDFSHTPVWARHRASFSRRGNAVADQPANVDEGEDAAKTREHRSQGKVSRAPVWARPQVTSSDDDKHQQAPKVDEGEIAESGEEHRNQGNGASKAGAWARLKGSSAPENETDIQQAPQVDIEGATKIWGHRIKRVSSQSPPVWTRPKSSFQDDKAEVPKADSAGSGQPTCAPIVALSRSQSWGRASVASSFEGDEVVEPAAEPASKASVVNRWKHRSDENLPAWARPKTRSNDETDELPVGCSKAHGRPPAWPRPTAPSTADREEEDLGARTQPEEEPRSKAKGVAERWERRFSGNGAFTQAERVTSSPESWKSRGQPRSNGEPKASPRSRQASPSRASDTWKRQAVDGHGGNPSDDARDSGPRRVRSQSPSWTRIKLRSTAESGDERKSHHSQDTRLTPGRTPDKQVQSSHSDPSSDGQAADETVCVYIDDNDSSAASDGLNRGQMSPSSPQRPPRPKPSSFEPSSVILNETPAGKKLSARQQWKLKQQQSNQLHLTENDGHAKEQVGSILPSQAVSSPSPTKDSPPGMQRLNSWKAETEKPSAQTTESESGKAIGDNGDYGPDETNQTLSLPKSCRPKRVSDVWEKRMQSKSSMGVGSKPPSYPSRSHSLVEPKEAREAAETDGEATRSCLRESEDEDNGGSTSVPSTSRVLDFTSPSKPKTSNQVGGFAEFWQPKSVKKGFSWNSRTLVSDLGSDAGGANGDTDEVQSTEKTHSATAATTEREGDKGAGSVVSQREMRDGVLESEKSINCTSLQEANLPMGDSIEENDRLDDALKVTQQNTISSAATSPRSEVRSSPEDEELKALVKDGATPTKPIKSWAGRSTGTPLWMKTKLKPIKQSRPIIPKSKADSADSDDVSERTTRLDAKELTKVASGTEDVLSSEGKKITEKSLGETDVDRESDTIAASKNSHLSGELTDRPENFLPVSSALDMWKRKVAAGSPGEMNGTPTRRTPTGVASKRSPSRKLSVRPSWASSPSINLDFPSGDEGEDDSTIPPYSPEAARSEVAWPVGNSPLVGERKTKSVASAPAATTMSVNVKERWRTRVIAPMNLAPDTSLSEGQVLSSKSDSVESVQEISETRGDVGKATSGYFDDRELIDPTSSNSSAARRLPKPPRDSPLLQLGKKYRSPTPDLLKRNKKGSSEKKQKKPDLSVKALVELLADPGDRIPRLGAKPMSSPRHVETHVGQSASGVSSVPSDDSDDTEFDIVGTVGTRYEKKVLSSAVPAAAPSLNRVKGKGGDDAFEKDESFSRSQAFGSPRAKLLVNPMNKKKIQQHRSRLRRIRSGESAENFAAMDGSGFGRAKDELTGATIQDVPVEKGGSLEAQAARLREERVNERVSSSPFPSTLEGGCATTPKGEAHNFSGGVSKLKAKFENQSGIREPPNIQSLTMISPEDPVGIMSPFASPSSQIGAFTPYSAKFRSPKGSGGRSESYFSPSSFATESPVLRTSPNSTVSVASSKTPKHHYSNSANRYQHKKQLAARKKTLPSPKSDAGSDTLSFFSGASDASAPASAFSTQKSSASINGSISTLASRATHLLKGRRQPKKKEVAEVQDDIKKPKEEVPVVDDLLLNFNQASVSPESEEKPAVPVFHLQEAPRLPNRYNTASRFMDAPMPVSNVVRRMEPTPTFSYDESHATGESSTLNSTVSATSEDNSEWGRHGVRRTRSESTMGSRQTNPMVDSHFVREFNHFEELRGAYKSVNLQQLAADMKEEVASSFSGVTDMVSKSLRHFGSPRKPQTPTRQAQAERFWTPDLPQPENSKSHSLDGEEVAIEVEYIGDSYPEEESDIQSSGDIDHIRASEVAAAIKRRQRRMNQATAGQPSHEASETDRKFTFAEI